jgi:hypothetical protein
MPFIEKNGLRVLFIHIPKTGGTSMEKWLESLAPLHLFCNGLPSYLRCTPQHLRLRDINEILKPVFFDYQFALVRDPYARLESEFRMHNSWARQGFFGGGPSFSLWLEENLERQKRDPFHFDNHLRPQWEFIGSDVEIFRMEDGLLEPMRKVAKLLKIPATRKARHELNTGEKTGKIVWDRSDRLMIQEFYRLDFETFGYSME